jgi:dimethylaniline monooxygenase (N-oxide forming)
MAEYLDAYAKHNDLHKHFRLGTKILKVAPTSSSPTQWSIRFVEGEEEKIEVFDRVVVTIGPHSSAWFPAIEGREKFGGTVIPAQAYKE